MNFLSHRHATLSHHVLACIASAAIAATMVTLVHGALMPFASKSMGYSDLSARGVTQALFYAWSSVALFCLALCGIVFSAMRMVLNRIQANLGIFYVAAAVGLSAWVMASGQARRGTGADQIGIAIAICIGLIVALVYWRLASRHALDGSARHCPVEIFEREGKLYARYEARSLREVEISNEEAALVADSESGAAAFLDSLDNRAPA